MNTLKAAREHPLGFDDDKDNPNGSKKDDLQDIKERGLSEDELAKLGGVSDEKTQGNPIIGG